MTNTITLHQAATMLAKSNPDKGDYEFFKKKLINAVEKGELAVFHTCNEECEKIE